MKKKKSLDSIKHISMAVFDLDGTLLNTKDHFSEETLNTLIKIKNKGVKIVVASGRIYPMLKAYIDKIGIVDYVISANGASIDQVDINKQIDYTHVNPSDALKIVEFSRNNKIECLILKREVTYHPIPSDRLNKFLSYNKIAESYGYQQMKLTPYNQSFDAYDFIEKILINEESEEKKQLLESYIKINTNLKYTRSGKLLLDISSQEVSKANALKKVSKITGIPLSEIIAFGDYDNDVEMLALAGFGVAPKNASPKAIEASDYVTASNDEDGVAKVLNILIEKGIIE